MANSVGPVEMAHYEPSHHSIYTVCNVCFDAGLKGLTWFYFGLTFLHQNEQLHVCIAAVGLDQNRTRFIQNTRALFI